MNTNRKHRHSNKKISNNQAKRNFPADFFDQRVQSLDRRSTIIRCQTEDTGEFPSAQSSRQLFYQSSKQIMKAQEDSQVRDSYRQFDERQQTTQFPLLGRNSSAPQLTQQKFSAMSQRISPIDKQLHVPQMRSSIQIQLTPTINEMNKLQKNCDKIFYNQISNDDQYNTLQHVKRKMSQPDRP